MEYKFLICDDIEEHIQILEKYVQNYCKKNSIKNYILKTTSGLETIEICKKNSFDIIFLDIGLNDIDGIKVAKDIRKQDNNVLIIFVTAHTDYTIEAFENFAFNYILKPIDEKKLFKIMNKAIKMINDIKFAIENNRYYKVNKNGKISKIFYHDILFFEKKQKNVIIYTEKTTISFKETFKQLENEIDMIYFVKCHQGYIVNSSKIQTINKSQIILYNYDKPINISRKYKDYISKRFF